MRTKQRKVMGSSWLIEAASYGAELVEPVPNRLIKKIQNLVRKFLIEKKNKKKKMVLNFEPG